MIFPECTVMWLPTPGSWASKCIKYSTFVHFTLLWLVIKMAEWCTLNYILLNQTPAFHSAGCTLSPAHGKRVWGLWPLDMWHLQECVQGQSDYSCHMTTVELTARKHIWGGIWYVCTHCTWCIFEYRAYRIAENFWGRKHSWISWF